MARRDIIVVGASAGGVEALIQLVRGLPADLPAALFVTVHVPANGVSALPSILSRQGPLPAHHPRDGEEIRHGRIYVAPPDHHLLVKNGCVRVASGPKENSARPAVDPMFRTAARAYGPRVAAVVLTGNLDDGTAGSILVKRHGGTVVAQDPEEALYPGMPGNAIRHGEVEFVLPLAEIPGCLVQLAHGPEEGDEGSEAPTAEAEEIADIAETSMVALDHGQPDESASGYICPECGGPLWEEQASAFSTFRCRIGHAYGQNTLLAEQEAALEAALWTALRTLEENASLSRRMCRRMEERGQPELAERFRQQLGEAQQRAEVIRSALIANQAEA